MVRDGGGAGCCRAWRRRGGGHGGDDILGMLNDPAGEPSLAMTGAEDDEVDEQEEDEDDCVHIGLGTARDYLDSLFNFVLDNEVLKAHEDALYKLQRAVYAMTECSLTRQTTIESFFPKQKEPEPLMDSMEVD